MTGEFQKPVSSEDQVERISRLSDPELDRILGVLRGRIEEEFRITERVDLKSRQLFALAAGAFAGAQIAAYAALASTAVSHPKKIVTLALAIAGAVALGALTLLVHRNERLRDEQDLRPLEILDWCMAEGATNIVSARLVLALSHVAQLRAGSNVRRKDGYEAISRAVFYTLLLYAVELVFALVVRV
jgi:hypothetical protein